jgi:hypothetical protein
MALPSLADDGRVVVPAIHRFARAENKPRAGNTLELQNAL